MPSVPCNRYIPITIIKVLGCLSHYIAYIIFKEFNHVAIGFYRYTCINTNLRNYLLDLCPHKLLFTQLAQYLGEVVIGSSSTFQSGLESINESRLSSNLCQEQSQLNSVVCFHLLYQKLCQPDKVRFSILCQVQSQLNRVVCFHLLYKKLCQPDKVRFFHLIPGTDLIKQCWLRNTTSRYLDDILNINNVYFDNIVNQIYPSELQLNKANTSDTEATFLDLHLSISNDIVSTKIYDKRNDFDFEIVNFTFLDGDVPRSTSYGVYISQLIRFC